TFFENWVDGELTPERSGTALGGARDGVLAEQVVLSEDALVPLPRGFSFEEGATLPCAALTAWHALRPLGNLRSGETVLLQGTGGVSIFGLQFAKAMGARVLITSSSDEKLARARALGADVLINYQRTPDWELQVLEHTGGGGVDHVLEVGGAGTLPRSVRATRKDGRITLIGRLTGTHGKADAALMEPKRLHAQGIYVGSRRMFEEMNAFLTEHRIKPVIDRAFPFAQARDAYREMKRGGHFGKIVITV
ncbi:MAG TPA: NAD(P)-dependent alcohol dehydrogenase, partial [Myxococcaceae bacterium]|nr:NAD(P)-dependent alcohol dehydrogenase [Myxococcaceae bacterium]